MSQDFPSKKILRKVGKLGIKSHRQILQGHVAPHEKFGKETVRRKELCTSANLKNAIRVRQSMRRGHFRKPCDTNDAPAEKHGTWQNMSISSIQGTRPRSTPLTEALVMPAPSTTKARGVDAHAEQKADKDTHRKSINPATVITAIGEVPSSEEAQVYVHDRELFVTVQILDDTSAVLSLGKLCEEHGCTYEWASGQKPHLTHCARQKISFFVPGLSSSSSSSSSSTPFPQDSSSTSPSPARLRSDDTNAQASGDRGDPPKIKNKKKKTGNNQATRSRLRDLPEWFEEFTDNLEDTEVPALANFS